MSLVACGGAKSSPKSPADGESGPGGPAEVGKAAPDLSIQTVNGKGEVALDGLGGKVVVVDFWATWCGPCRQSFPALEALAKRHEGKVAVVGVSVNDEPDGIKEFASELGTTFPVGWDKGHAIAERWKVESMPTTFILDGSKTVRFVHAGYHGGEEAEMEIEVRKLLESAGDAPKEASAAPPPSAPAPAADTPPPQDDAPAADQAPPPPKPSKGTKPGKKKKPSKKKKPKAPAAT